MSASITKSDLVEVENRLEQRIEKAVEDIASIIHDFSQQAANEFRDVNSRIDKIETSIDRLTNTLDGFAKRVADAEVENAARKAQLLRLIEWAKKVSEKTGVALPSELS